MSARALLIDVYDCLANGIQHIRRRAHLCRVPNRNGCGIVDHIERVRRHDDGISRTGDNRRCTRGKPVNPYRNTPAIRAQLVIDALRRKYVAAGTVDAHRERLSSESVKILCEIAP